MTRRMVEAGHAVLAVDADPARIPACGATSANGLAELAERCDVIMLSLPDSPVIESVIRNPGGLLEHARDGQVIVDLSTANPASTRALHDELAGRGVRYLDTGISGGAAGAETGNADPDGRRRRSRPGPGKTAARHVQRSRAPHGRQRRGPRDEGAQQLPQRRHAGRDGRGHGGGQEGRARPSPAAGGDQHLHRCQLRLPQPVPAHHQGRLPRGRADRAADGKDVRLYLDLAEDLGVVTLVGPGTRSAFQGSNASATAPWSATASSTPSATGPAASASRSRPQEQQEETAGGLKPMQVSHGKSGQPSEHHLHVHETVHMDR